MLSHTAGLSRWACLFSALSPLTRGRGFFNTRDSDDYLACRRDDLFAYGVKVVNHGVILDNPSVLDGIKQSFLHVVQISAAAIRWVDEDLHGHPPRDRANPIQFNLYNLSVLPAFR